MRDLVFSITPPNLMLSVMTAREKQKVKETLSEMRERVLDHLERRCCFCLYREHGDVARRICKSVPGDPPESPLTIIPLNGNPRDLSPGNLEIACIFCQAVNSLNTVEHPDAWTVIYLPGVPQAYISWISRAIFLMSQVKFGYDQDIARSGQDSTDEPETSAMYVITEAVSSLMRKLRDAQDAVSLHPGFQTISDLAQNLVDLSHRNTTEYNSRDELMSGFKLIPKACIDDDWSLFLKYRTLMFQASEYAGINSFRDMALLARQTYQMIYTQAFPAGDPLDMRREFDIV